MMNSLFEFQAAVWRWCVKCFGEDLSYNREIRIFRFLEESLELAQTAGCSKEDALKLIDYVYARPMGEEAMEAGQVLLTLCAFANASEFDLYKEAEVELERVNAPEMIEKIRKKQASKPHNSPLPVPDGN